jgi:hypothetical protein
LEYAADAEDPDGENERQPPTPAVPYWCRQQSTDSRPDAEHGDDQGYFFRIHSRSSVGVDEARREVMLERFHG